MSFFSDFSTSALGPGTPAKRSVSKNDGQRYQGNVLNRIQSRDFGDFVFYRGERLFGMRLGRFITLYRSMHALRFTSMDARFSFRSALARFALYLYQMLPYKYASLTRCRTIWDVRESFEERINVATSAGNADVDKFFPRSR